MERVTETVPVRDLWEACLNVRDIGGMRCGNGVIKTGRLVRGSTLGALTPDGRSAMRKFGIRTVLDLRGDDEVAAVPSPFAEGATYQRIPLNSMRMMALHDAAHAGTLVEELRAIAVAGGGLAEAVAALAAADPPIVLHCMAGRDRTGLVVALVLAAIGVPDEDIVADYVASDSALQDEYKRFKSANPDRAVAVDTAVAKRAWVMTETLRTLREIFGGAARYLVVAGARTDDITSIHAKLTA